jgi:uncharacterized protein (TIGR02300 family)
VNAVSDPRGLKRICLSCGTRYYDLNKRPIKCPSCNAEFKIEAKAKGRGRRVAANDEPKVAAVVETPAEETEVEIIETDEDTVSLEEVEVEEVEEADADLAAGPDLEIPDVDDADDDDTDDEEDVEADDTEE